MGIAALEVSVHRTCEGLIVSPYLVIVETLVICDMLVSERDFLPQG